MSWTSWNDSLNSLKGQITTFANNVLAETDEPGQDVNGLNDGTEELKRICSQQREEINNLLQRNEELRRHLENNTSAFSNDESKQSEANWNWDLPDPSKTTSKEQEVIPDLKSKISELQNEKQDLILSLEQLDNECQSNTEKLVSIKNKLQNEYNDLEETYTKLKEDNENLIKKEQKHKREFEDLKSKYDAALKNKSVQNEETANQQPCTKCENFLKENQRFTSEIELLKNEVAVLTSNKLALLEDVKIAHVNELAELVDKLKLSESENKILVSEMQKATQTIVDFKKKSAADEANCKKLASILEGYEQQVSSLKQELLVVKDDESRNTVADLEIQLQKAIEEKNQTHVKYVNILTESMKRYADCDKSFDRIHDSHNELDPQIGEFSHQVESILNILLDLKSKCESLESELYNVSQEKTNLLSEKNYEIEKLIQNSEILSQEVITKTQTIKDYENECNELIKNNDMLINELEILKNSSGLQTISESNEDNLLLLETQLENANKKIEELEGIILKLEDEASKDSPSGVNEQLLLNELDQLKTENNYLTDQVKIFVNTQETLNEEKDYLIASLEKMKSDLENTEYQYMEINITVETLKEESENQKKKIEKIFNRNLELEKSNIESERNNEVIRTELNMIREKLLIEEDIRKQLEGQVRNLIEKLQNAKMCETSLKLQYDTISKELAAMSETKNTLEMNLKNSITNFGQCQANLLEKQTENDELREALSALEIKLESYQDNEKEINKISDTSSTDQLKEENARMLHNSNELREQLDAIVVEKNILQAKVEELKTEHSSCSQIINALENQVSDLTSAKNELTNVVINKHQENITYHNEIQRLTQILNAEADKGHNLEIQLDTLKSSSIDNSEMQIKDEEIEKLTDQNNFLRQKCEVLAENLLQEQLKVQQIVAEHSSPSEKEHAFSKKLERLQNHLIEVEEHYTQELLRAEERNSELRTKVTEIEQREKNSSTMYTSVSIRANQHVETLQNQLQLITNQRDELRKKISDAEDHASKQEAALANLQFVLEQFQKDKEKDVQNETERIRRQIILEKRLQDDLKNEIANLQSQLQESKHGLQAASRLSDQLEHSKQLISILKGEVSQIKEKLSKSEEKLHNLSSQTDGKVDKSLIKNLVIGFVSTNNYLNKDQTQILKIIATVLDFNQQDHDKIGLNKSQQSWLSSVLGPQTSQGMSHESLSQAFVKFLENESKPRSIPSLLSSNGETPQSRKTSTASVPRQSPSILSEVVLPTFADFAQNRNSSSILKDVLKDGS